MYSFTLVGTDIIDFYYLVRCAYFQNAIKHGNANHCLFLFVFSSQNNSQICKIITLLTDTFHFYENKIITATFT